MWAPGASCDGEPVHRIDPRPASAGRGFFVFAWGGRSGGIHGRPSPFGRAGVRFWCIFRSAWRLGRRRVWARRVVAPYAGGTLSCSPPHPSFALQMPPSPLWGEGFAGGHMGPPLQILTDGADGRKHLIRHGLRPCHPALPPLSRFARQFPIPTVAARHLPLIRGVGPLIGGIGPRQRGPKRAPPAKSLPLTREVAFAEQMTEGETERRGQAPALHGSHHP